MLILSSTSDLIRVVTGSAGDVSVHATWLDNASGVITPARTNTNISSATTTTVVSSPGSSVQRNVRFLAVSNNHATNSNDITITHYDGAVSVVLWMGSLAAGETASFGDPWKVAASSGSSITLAGTPDYITLAGSVITRNAIDLTTDITGTLPVANGGTGQTTLQSAVNALMAASGALATGDVFCYNGTNVAKLAAGSAGQVLSTNGTSSSPSWITVSSGPTEHWSILTSNFNLSTSSGVQSIFGSSQDVITVAASTLYLLEAFYNITRTTNTASTSTAFELNEGASLNSILYRVISKTSAALGTPACGTIDTETSTSALTTSSTGGWISLRGLIYTNAAGTITPQIAFSSSVTSPVMTALSYIRLRAFSGSTGGNVA